MGTLKDCKNVIRHKKVFIMDRNDGRCYHATKRQTIDRLMVIFGDRFIEQIKPHGSWIWIILDRIPGHFKGGKLNERLSADYNSNEVR